jgi:hypothetical protein
VPLGRAVDVPKPVPVGEPPGEIDGGVAEGEPPAQAETDTDASTVTVAQPMALNLPLSRVPAMVVRILMGPPHASAEVPGPFPVPASETGPGTEIAYPARVLLGPGKSQKAPSTIKAKAAGRTDGQWLVHHWDIRLRVWGTLRKTGEGRHWGRRSGNV